MQVQSRTGAQNINGLPSVCPFCHRSITPNLVYSYRGKEPFLHVYLSCPDHSCQESFIAYYATSGATSHFSGRVSTGNIKDAEFKAVIHDVSSNFITIYNQAYFAEQNNLVEICGVGYRKALEFLIKDYSILRHPDKTEEIQRKLLGQCIKDYVDDTRVKTVAKRATWLGNDETHYIRKWEGRNLTDLKLLIELTVHWIEMEKLTADFEREMPE